MPAKDRGDSLCSPKQSRDRPVRGEAERASESVDILVAIFAASSGPARHAAPLAVILTSILSPGAAEPDPLEFEQVPFVLELTVHESSVAPVVLSMTATPTFSVPLSVVFDSAYTLVTVAPLAGVPANRLLVDRPVDFAGQVPVPGPVSAA
jgi:hypothetical protein